jgi:hypothetical protein
MPEWWRPCKVGCEGSTAAALPAPAPAGNRVMIVGHAHRFTRWRGWHRTGIPEPHRFAVGVLSKMRISFPFKFTCRMHDSGTFEFGSFVTVEP